MPQDAGLPDPSGPLPAPHPRSRGPIAGRIDAPPRPTPPAVSAPPALSAAPDLMGLLLALRHRWVSAVLLGGTLGAIASVAMWFLLTPKNVAFAQIKVAYYEPGMWPDRNAGNPGDFKTYLQTTAGEIMSRRVIAGALNRDEVKRLHLTFGDQNPSQAVSEDLRVEFKENSELLTIFYTHAEATAATTVANAVMEAFMEDIVYAKRNERAQGHRAGEDLRRGGREPQDQEGQPEKGRPEPWHHRPAPVARATPRAGHHPARRQAAARADRLQARRGPRRPRHL